MVTSNKDIGSIKRVGVRYGRTVRHKVGTIESAKRASTKCPYCNKNQASRISAGIWSCSKCGSKFTAGAYTIKRKLAVKSE